MLYYYLLLCIFLIHKEGLAMKFTVVNRCSYTVWPGILSSSGSSPIDATGFELQAGGVRSFQAPPGWSGRFWGRTGCTFDVITGNVKCLTGDCGSNQIECNGGGAEPPVTLAEFTIGAGAQDFYDISLVDGYNLPMSVEPIGGSGECGSTMCAADVSRMCPNELIAVNGQACRSACEAFGYPEYCCSGPYSSPATCRPSAYSETFKNVCPNAYSYAYDDATSTFTCTGADYTITFCPLLTSQKSSRDSSSVVVPGGSGSGASESDSRTQDDLPWLPNFFSSSDMVLSPNRIVVTFLFLSLFLVLWRSF